MPQPCLLGSGQRSMEGSDAVMFELSSEQQNAINAGQPVRLVNPATQQAMMLLREVDFERICSEGYDASPWTDEEMDLLATEDADGLGMKEQCPMST